jgi:hypothetical protein
MRGGRNLELKPPQSPTRNQGGVDCRSSTSAAAWSIAHETFETFSAFAREEGEEWLPLRDGRWTPYS